MKRHEIRWAAWLSASAVSFAALERQALKSGRNELTLSAALRHWLGLVPRRKGSRLSGIGFLLALGWVAAHILDGFEE